MIYLLLSIACSVTVGVLLKLAKRYQIRIIQAITWNYLFAIGLCAVFLKPSFQMINMSIHDSYYIYALLGILLPVIFLVQGAAVQQAGLARTDIAQRLSLFISMAAALFLFREEFGVLKYVGLALGFLAIIFTLYRKRQANIGDQGALQLVLVFIGFGVIDVLFKMVSAMQFAPYGTSLFIIFCLAFLLSLAYIIYLAITGRGKLQLINFVCGCVLGFFNFGNILFYLKAHQSLASSPFIVFATMNIGVIVIGSLIGIVAFGEKLSKLNYLGLALALLAIGCITLSKLYVL